MSTFNFNQLAFSSLSSLRSTAKSFTAEVQESFNKHSNETLTTLKTNISDLKVTPYAYVIANTMNAIHSGESKDVTQGSTSTFSKMINVVKAQVIAIPISYALEYVKTTTLSVIDYIQENNLVQNLTDDLVELVDSSLQQACDYFVEKQSFEQKYDTWLAKNGDFSVREKELLTTLLRESEADIELSQEQMPGSNRTSITDIGSSTQTIQDCFAPALKFFNAAYVDYTDTTDSNNINDSVKDFYYNYTPTSIDNGSVVSFIGEDLWTSTLASGAEAA